MFFMRPNAKHQAHGAFGERLDAPSFNWHRRMHSFKKQGKWCCVSPLLLMLPCKPAFSCLTTLKRPGFLTPACKMDIKIAKICRIYFSKLPHAMSESQLHPLNLQERNASRSHDNQSSETKTRQHPECAKQAPLAVKPFTHNPRTLEAFGCRLPKTSSTRTQIQHVPRAFPRMLTKLLARIQSNQNWGQHA